MMKKLLSLLAGGLVALSINANPISRAKALQLAQEFMVPGHQLTVTAEAKPRHATGKSAPYYIISRGENQGFVIVSGDDCLPTILGYTECGDYNEEDMPDAFREWMDYRADIIEKAQATGSNTPYDEVAAAQRRAAANRVDVPELLTTLWHQDTPYNNKCPIRSNGSRAIVGCVATAASQIIYYWRRDANNTLGYDTPTYTYGDAPATAEFQLKKGTPIMFDFMKNSYSGSESALYKDAVATLCAAVGMSAWLTYGPNDTAGQIDNCRQVFSGHFGLNGGTCVYKDWGGYNETSWSELLYNQLIKGRPLLYCGSKSETEGHAVVCDGYQASTGFFHINFGWGGGWNGYFSVVDDVEEGGWGFNLDGGQGCVYDIYPRHPNVEVALQMPAVTYKNVSNEVKIKLTNKGTLPFSGLYLFAKTSASNPTSLSDAKSKDTETVVEVDGTGTYTLSFKPTYIRTWYVTITDQYLNVLAQTSVTPETAVADLTLQGLSVDGSSDTETFDGHDFQVIYNKQSTAHALIANASNVGYEGNAQMDFYAYDEQTKDWTLKGSKSSAFKVAGDAKAEATFNILNSTACPLELNTYYIGKLAKTTSQNDEIKTADTADSLIRFVLKDNDMEVVGFENGILSLKGHFDATAFESRTFAGKPAYKTATIYDLTQCSSVGYVHQNVNPNALIYVADGSQATGTNVVCEGKCAHLELTPGYDFTPMADFIAETATLHIDSEPGTWCLLTVPFDATVPDGIIAQNILSHISNGITSRTADVQTLEAGKTYLIMSSSSRRVTLTGTNTKVVAAPVENTDAALTGTYVNTQTPAQAFVLNQEETQYFEAAEEGTPISALQGYWNAPGFTRAVRADSKTSLATYYRNLALAINEAYETLEDYADIVTKEAHDSYLAEIENAESIFSHRGMEASVSEERTKVQNCSNALVADGKTYTYQIVNAGAKEVDFTGKIINPSFENTRSLEGWTLGEKEGVTTVGSVYNGTAENSYRTIGIDGQKFFQSLIKTDASSVSISQTVTGLAPGYYRLTAMLGTDATSTITLFAGESETKVDAHPFGSYYLTKGTVDRVRVLADEGETTGSLNIGVRGGNWYKADAFTLTYVGGLTAEDQQDATGIDGLKPANTTTSKGIYTLQGVHTPTISQTDVYIIDGKKVLMK